MRKHFLTGWITGMIFLLAHSLLAPTLSFALVGEPSLAGSSPTSASLISTLLLWGDKIAAWALALLSSVLTGYVVRRYLRGIAADILARAVSEIIDAVAEVKQTFVDSLKDAAADGRLTQPEMKEARERAIVVAKANIGPKGLARLGRILGVDSLEQWLTTKVEAVVAGSKIAPVAPPSKTASGTVIGKPPLPPR